MAPKERSRRPRLESYTLSSLDQIKVLADPLRIRILEALCRERTTKQVADQLGEKPTKLYHHVDALEKVGLVERTRMRQNRGTLEKYYLAVASRFQADSRLFQATDESGTGEEAQALRGMMSTIFDTTAGELGAVIDRGGATRALEEEGIVSFLEVRASAEDLADIRERLHELVMSLADRCESSAGEGEVEDARRFRFTLAYFPLPAAEGESGSPEEES